MLSQVPETLVRPAVFLGLIGTVWLLGGRLTPASAMGLQLVAVGAAFVLGAIWLLRSLPQETTSAAAAYETRTWAASALPFLLIGGINVVNGQIGLIMLGWFGTAAEVGVYRVAAIGSGVVLMAFSTAWGVLGPTVARLYALGETAQLQRVLTLSARAILLFSLPVTIALILFGERILSAVFGPEYAGGATALAILAVGQLVNAGMGLAILLLNMSGNERDTARGVALAAALNVALNAGLIPLWGTNGAALATTLSLLAWRLAAAGLVRRRTGLHATAFGPVRFKPHTRKPKPR